MADDVIVNKAGSIERCLRRITEEYGGDRRNLFDNQTKQDAIVLNLQRACETAIDLAMYLARIIHEPFCCNRRSAVPTALRSSGSPLGPSRLRAPVSRRGSAISRRTVMNNAG